MPDLDSLPAPKRINNLKWNLSQLKVHIWRHLEVWPKQSSAFWLVADFQHTPFDAMSTHVVMLAKHVFSTLVLGPKSFILKVMFTHWWWFHCLTLMTTTNNVTESENLIESYVNRKKKKSLTSGVGTICVRAWRRAWDLMTCKIAIGPDYWTAITWHRLWPTCAITLHQVFPSEELRRSKQVRKESQCFAVNRKNHHN